MKLTGSIVAALLAGVAAAGPQERLGKLMDEVLPKAARRVR